MSYILKNTAGLVNTQITDTARKKISQGSFNISYFQIGDSEVSYNTLPSSYGQVNTQILQPAFNAQNSAGVPESNKHNVKYPYYVDGITGNTYGIPFMDSIVSPVYNRAVMRGFFSGDTSLTNITWSALTNNQYVINSNYVLQMSSLNCSITITLIHDVCNSSPVRGPQPGDFITIYYDGNGLDNCYCKGDQPITTTTTTYIPVTTTTTIFGASPTPTPTPTETLKNPCESPTPTPTPSATFCPTPTPSAYCPPPPPPDCKMSMSSCYPILTYRIVSVCGNEITLDRPTPDYTYLNNKCFARVLIYPPKMTEIYDSITPLNHWSENVINFESICTTDEFDVKVWNMNIPWSENPAGLISSISKDYTNFGSISYLGTKEYLGYISDSGQTDTSSVYYYNSFDEKITLKPEEQKAIAIIHYTNNTIDFFYGEKFALETSDPNNPEDDSIGLAKNFKIHIPWIMWHKNPECCYGQTFWVDPPGFEGRNLFQVHYLESKKNLDMNNPGIRYYHLWDNNPNSDGNPSRVGKVFPDHKIVVIDDEEIIAAMSYKANRNWTLPAPKISLITPNICGVGVTSDTGILTGDSQYLYVTYRLTDTNTCLNGLHCNYYSLIQGANTCLPLGPQNVSVRFGPEFQCLSKPSIPTTTTTTFVPVTTTTTNSTSTTTTTTLPTCSCWEISEFGDTANVIVTDDLGNSYQKSIEGPVAYVCSCSVPFVIGVLSAVITELGTCDGTPQCSGFTYQVNNVLQNTPLTLTTTFNPITTTTTYSPVTTTTTCPIYCDNQKGFYANKFEIICQKVDRLGRPNSSQWKVIDFTEQLIPTMYNGYITQEGLTGNTFVITQELYDDAPTYNLDNYIPITPVGFSGTQLNFGDEYYFYGSLESDIQSTIYEMRYKVNLSQAEFQTSSNPTWKLGTPSYVTEIGLYDSDKNLMIISKMQSPILRQGIQQFLIKFDF